MPGCLAGLDEPLVKHPFHGTSAVVDDLRAFPGFQDGLVVLTAANQVWDDATGELCGYKLSGDGAAGAAPRERAMGAPAVVACAC